jgi:excisionase family DNA binding protein
MLEANMDEFLTVGEAMRELKICRNTLNKHIRSGQLMAYRVGRLVRITRGDLEEFVKHERSNCRRPSRRAATKRARASA